MKQFVGKQNEHCAKTACHDRQNTKICAAAKKGGNSQQGHQKDCADICDQSKRLCILGFSERNCVRLMLSVRQGFRIQIELAFIMQFHLSLPLFFGMRCAEGWDTRHNLNRPAARFVYRVSVTV